MRVPLSRKGFRRALRKPHIVKLFHDTVLIVKSRKKQRQEDKQERKLNGNDELDTLDTFEKLNAGYFDK